MDRRNPKSPQRKVSPLTNHDDDFNTFVKSMENSTRKILQDNVSRRKNRFTASSSSHPSLVHRSSSSNHTLTSPSSNMNEDGCTDAFLQQEKCDQDNNMATTEDSNLKTQQDVTIASATMITKDSKNKDKGGPLSKKQWRKATKELVRISDGGEMASPELSSSTLRSKYRCIQHNDHATSLVDSTDHSNSIVQPTVGTRSEQGKTPSVEKHPIYTLLQSHIRNENEKLRKLDEEVIKMKAASVLDRHAEWSLKIKALGDEVFKEKKTISFNIEEERAMLELEMEREGMCKTKAESSSPQQELHIDMEGIPATFEPDQVPAPRIEKPNEKMYRIAPEIWPLIVCEPLHTPASPVDDDSILVSIHRVHERTSYNIHQKCFVYGEQPFWIVELYHQADCSEEFYFSKESEIIQMIASLPNDDSLSRGDRVLVHSESSSTQNYQIQKTVFVQTNCMRTVASIQVNISRSTPNTEIVFTEIVIPVFEIIIRLKKQNTWRAMEQYPWHTSTYDSDVWLQLLQLIEIDLETSMEREDVVWRWSNGDITDEDSMKSHDWKMTASAWNQPSVPLSNDKYLPTVLQAYDYIFHLCETSRCENEIYDHLRRDMVDSVDQRQIFETIWNQRNEGHPPHALRLMGLDRIFSETLLQGSCVIETLRFPNPLHDNPVFEVESEDDIKATVVATFDRDDKSMNPPAVSVSVAFDTPIVAPIFKETDYEYVLPPLGSPKPLDDSALKLMGEKGPILVPFKSAFENREPSTIIVLDPAGEDDINKTKHHKESRRSLPTFNEDNFRVKCFAHPFEIKEEPFVAQPFGISKDEVTPNKTTVHPPSQWHSEEICTSIVSRESNPRELYDLLMKEMPNRLVPTPNDPLIATVRFKGYKIGSIEFTPKQEFMQKEKERSEIEEKKRKDEILANKIAVAEKLLEQRGEKERLDILEECRRDNNLVCDRLAPSLDDIIPAQCHDDEQKKLSEEKDAQDLVQSLTKGRIMTCPDPQFFKSVSKPRVVGLIDPSTIPEERRCDMNLLRVKPSTQFISNVLQDRIQMARGRDENKRFQEMILNASQQDALELLLRIPIGDKTHSQIDGLLSVDHEIMRSEVKSTNAGKRRDESTADIQQEQMLDEYKNLSIAEKEYQAIMAVKGMNYTVLEELLDGCALDVETQDEFGNTLFILACQQACKKMAKFLLRRGAHIDAQNHTGNTALHYLYEYEHLELADYLLRKGADDTLLNAHGFTCYEGVTNQANS